MGIESSKIQVFLQYVCTFQDKNINPIFISLLKQVSNCSRQIELEQKGVTILTTACNYVQWKIYLFQKDIVS